MRGVTMIFISSTTRQRARAKASSNGCGNGCLDVPDHRSFLNHLGQERIEKLKPREQSFCPASQFQLLIVKKFEEEIMKTVPSMKLSQEGCDIIVNAAIEKAKELKQVGQHLRRRCRRASNGIQAHDQRPHA